VTVHVILVIYQDQVDVYPAMELSISSAKPASPIVQLGSIHLPMSVWDVTPHAILVTKQDYLDALLVLDLLNFIILHAFRLVQRAILNFLYSQTSVQNAPRTVKLVMEHLLSQIALVVCRGTLFKEIPVKQAAIKGIQTTTQLKYANSARVIVKPVLEDLLQNAPLV
jgi:hypothetical protein